MSVSGRQRYRKWRELYCRQKLESLHGQRKRHKAAAAAALEESLEHLRANQYRRNRDE